MDMSRFSHHGHCLTPKQLDFFEKLLEFRRREGVAPSIRELQKLCGFKSPRSVVQFLDALEAGGFIERREGARNIRVLLPPPSPSSERTETVLVPLLGRVAAGLPILAIENVEEHFPVSTRLARPPHHYFLLRVQGDSMNRAGMEDGSLVLVRQQHVAEAGECVLALIDDAATVKRLRPGRGTVVLEPDSTNPAHRPIIVDEQFQIQGVVIGTVPLEREEGRRG